MLSPHLKNREEQRNNFSKEQRFLLDVISVENFVQKHHRDIEIIYVHEGSGTLEVAASYVLLEKIINDTNIRFLDIVRKPKEESLLPDPDFRFNRVRKVQNKYPHLKGHNHLISIKERSFDPDDIDLREKAVYLGLESQVVSQHATGIATTIAGAGNSSPVSTGVAPHAKLTPSDFAMLLPDDEQLLAQAGVFVQNHSYGVGVESYYGVEGVAYDQSVSSEPRLLHIFSTGNAGMEQPDHGAYKGLSFSNLTGNFKHAKNVLTVGALDTAMAVSPYNSIGPAYDGRIKPELVAYGSRGTSDAAAIVSGIAALVQQAFLEHTDSLPHVSMVKALLIAGADEAGPEGIDFYTGYGNVNAAKTIELVKKNQIQSFRLTKGNKSSWVIHIPENVSDLRVAVSWTDIPADAGNERALINDVDALLEKNGQQWYPWVLKSNPDSQALDARPNRAEDHLNNNEFISISYPEPGPYLLTLNGENLVSDQIVSTAWHFDYANQFDWDFPTESDVLIAGNQERIYWNSTFKEEKGQLYYRLLDDNQWVELGLLGPEGFYEWDLPEVFGLAQLKMTIAGHDFLSDSFLISPVPDLSVSFNCEGKFGLEWPAVEGASDYRIYEMGEQQLELIGTTEDTTFVVEKKGAVFYSVAAAVENRVGMRSPAFNYVFQGAFCYFNFFGAERQDEQTIRVMLNLSTVNGIRSIDILKLYETDQKLISTFDPQGKTVHHFFDFDLLPGMSSYEAVLHFEDGSSLSSGPSNIYIEKQNAAILFPNPVEGNLLNVLTSGSGEIIRIFDRSGKLIIEKELLLQVDYIELDSFRAGLYFYQLVKAGRIIDKGKFVKY